MKLAAAAACLLLACAERSAPPPASRPGDARLPPPVPYVYVSTEAETRIFQLETATGTLIPRSRMTGGGFYMAWDPSKRFMYATQLNVAVDGGMMGRVTAYSIDGADGSLRFINSLLLPERSPVHVSVHPSGKWVFTAHFRNPGAAFVLPVLADGGLGSPVDMKTTASQAHQAYSFGSRYLFVPCRDGGKVMQYVLDETSGKLTENPPHVEIDMPAPPMTSTVGPRHIDVHPTKDVAYVANEKNGTITTYRIDKVTGRLTVLETLAAARTVGPGEADAGIRPENWSAHIAIHPNGRFVYVSNRRQNSIGVLSVKDDGTLAMLAVVEGDGLNVPWDFTFDPTSTFLIVVNQLGHSASVYEMSPTTGALTFKSRTDVQPQPLFVGALTLP